MKHTLLQHFQGALLGGWFGQRFIDNHPDNFAWQVLAEVLVDSLCQNSDAIDWQKVWENLGRSPIIQRENTSKAVNSIDQSTNQLAIFASENTSLTSFSEVFASLLPLILFYHENPHKLQKVLTEANNAIQNQWGKAVNYLEEDIRRQIISNNLANLITGLLQEKYNLSTLSDTQALFSLLFHQLSLADPLYQQLLLLQNLLIAGESLHRAIALLRTNGQNLGKEQDFDYQVYEPILIALYCFFDTPHNIQIAMYRAMQCPEKAEICLLLGILLGTYHSCSGIPRSWYISNALSKPASNVQTKELSRHQNCLSAIKHIDLMAEKLWLTWSGFYLSPHNADGNLYNTKIYNTKIAIAACNIMRPRPFQ